MTYELFLFLLLAIYLCSNWLTTSLLLRRTGSSVRLKAKLRRLKEEQAACNNESQTRIKKLESQIEDLTFRMDKHSILNG